MGSTAPLDVTVVGASVAGMRAAQALRTRGFTGAVRVLGAEPEPAYRRPALSKGYLGGTLVRPDIRLATAADLDVELELGRRVEHLDLPLRRLRVGGGEVLPFDGLIIATGARARVPVLPALDGVHAVRTVADVDRMRADLAATNDVVVIGGGLLGCEIAATCRGLGRDVTIVEAGPEPMCRPFRAEVGRWVRDLHAAHGVLIRVRAAVRTLRGSRRVEEVVLADGTVLAADLVVVAIGSEPDTDWLAGSGLDVQGGVGCAANLAVAGASRVTAAGDVVRWPRPDGTVRRAESWDSAVRQADAAARTLLDGPSAPAFTEPTMFWTEQYGHKIHLYGDADAADRFAVAEGSLGDDRCVGLYGRDGRVCAVLLVDAPARMAAYLPLVRERAPFPHIPLVDRAGGTR